MHVDIPAAAAASILREQAEWDKKRQKRSSQEYQIKCTRSHRNLQKKAKKLRYEQEKVYMECCWNMLEMARESQRVQ